MQVAPVRLRDPAEAKPELRYGTMFLPAAKGMSQDEEEMFLAERVGGEAQRCQFDQGVPYWCGAQGAGVLAEQERGERGRAELRVEAEGRCRVPGLVLETTMPSRTNG